MSLMIAWSKALGDWEDRRICNEAKHCLSVQKMTRQPNLRVIPTH